MKKFLKWVAMGFGALVVLFVVLAMTMSPEKKAELAAKREAKEAAEAQAKADQARQEADSMQTISASDYARAYDENTVAADATFKGKKFKVAGTVQDISTDLMGDPYLTLRGPSQFMSPHFKFDKGALGQLAAVKKGGRVTLVCTGRGDIAKTAMADDCALLQ